MAELGVHQSAFSTDVALCINWYGLFSPGWYVCVLAKDQLFPAESEIPGVVAVVNDGSPFSSALDVTVPVRSCYGMTRIVTSGRVHRPGNVTTALFVSW